LMVDRMAIPSTDGVDPAFAGFSRANGILSRHPMRRPAADNLTAAPPAHQLPLGESRRLA
jgi:hypothetical protein